MNLIKFYILLFYLLLVAVHSLGQSQVETLLGEAELNIKSGNYDVALNKVNSALSMESDNLLALQMQINIYYLKDDFKEALNLSDAAIEKYPKESEFYYLRGVANLAKQKYQKAINDFNKVLSATNSSVELYKVYLNRGVANMNLQEYQLAIEDFSESIDLNSNNASAYHSRGMLNYQLKDYQDAVDDFKKALQLNDNNPETHFNLGMSYFRLDDIDNACPYFHNACREGNENACRMVLLECTKNLPE